MTRQELAASEVVSFEDLRALAGAKNPCITITLTIPNPLQIQNHTKKAVREVEKGLKDIHIDGATAAALVEPIHALAAGIEEKGEWAKSMVVFRSPDLFRYFSMRYLEKEFVVVGQRFQIRPLLGLLSRYQRFYLLALSLKHVRVFHATHHSSEELEWRGLAPQSLQAWMNARQPDHVLDNRAAAGPSAGSMKGVLFGTNTDRERQDEFVKHFFKEVDKALEKILPDKTIPLILAGVEPEVALYRRVSTYPQLLDSTVHGSPEGRPARELHERALEIVRQIFSAPLKKAMDEFENYRGTSRASSRVDDVLKAAWEGRVSDLLLRQDAEYRGVCDEGNLQVRQERNLDHAEDLLNRAALETILHKGQAFAVSGSEMPDRGDAVAVFRF